MGSTTATTRFFSRLASVVLVILAARIGWVAVGRGPDVIALGIAVLLVLLAFQLFRCIRSVMRGFSSCLILIAVVLPVGIFNPFLAGDMMAAGQPPPTGSEILMWLVPTEIFLLVTAHFLSRHEPLTQV